MRVALLTSTALRHKYIAHQLAKEMDLALVIAEEKSAAITGTDVFEKEDAKLLENHFKNRNQSEEAFFGSFTNFPDSAKLKTIAHGDLNSAEVLEELISLKIDAVALFGSSIVKETILDFFPNKVLNLHLGLSPYYRGSGTNFFPLYYGEMECLGATFHLATNEVDAGGILHQLRLENITIADTMHSLGNKIIKEAGALYPKVLKEYLTGVLLPKPAISSNNGKLFRVKDFNAEVLRAVQSHLPENLKKFLESKEERMASTPIIKGI